MLKKPKQCLENILPDVELPVFQNLGVRYALEDKKMLLAFDTGTGKTFTYSVFIRALLNRNPEKKHIFVIIHDSLVQALDDIEGLVAAPAASFSATKGNSAKLARLWERTSVFLITYECFRLPGFIEFLYANLGDVESFVVDEAHHCANWDTSNTAFMIRALCRTIPYVAGLSATPVTSEKQQYYRLMNLIDRDLSSHRDETSMGAYESRYLAVNRGDYNIKGNYTTTLETVTPMPHQLGKQKGIVFKNIKGDGATNQIIKLVNCVRERLKSQKKILVYINYHDTRRWVESHFTEAGIPFESMHGKTPQQDRAGIQERFRTGENQVLITSISESLNLDADVVIFYEFTTKVKQMMGRAHRGLTGKSLEVVFIITPDTAEAEYFDKYIFKRSLSIQHLLGKDYSELISVGQQLKAMSLD